jgi:hypothetical protein
MRRHSVNGTPDESEGRWRILRGHRPRPLTASVDLSRAPVVGVLVLAGGTVLIHFGAGAS